MEGVKEAMEILHCRITDKERSDTIRIRRKSKSQANANEHAFFLPATASNAAIPRPINAHDDNHLEELDDGQTVFW